MHPKGLHNREQIIEATDRLFYERGYEDTSFSVIAEATGIPRGNFYHYFKTKNQLLEAVVRHRLEGIRAQLEQWSRELDTPQRRLHRYVQILRNSSVQASRFGCPMGSLNTELGKQHPDQQEQVRAMFELFFEWLEQQFRALGYTSEASQYARRLLAYTQGISVIAHAYRDEDFMRAEADQLDTWIEELVQTAAARREASPAAAG